MKHAFVVEAAEAGERVDRFVGRKLNLSRSTLKELFETNAVRVAGRKAKKGDEVSFGQAIEVEYEAPSKTLVADAGAPLVVLHEDEALVFVAKAAGTPSQPLEANETGTVANALLARYPEMGGVGDDPREAGLCHRLDVETSGVLLAARTRAAWEAMRRAFSAEREVDKRYLALVHGPIADEGEIEVPLEHAGDHVRPALTGSTTARPAKSEFTVLKRRGAFALVEVKLITGVLHQVRAHLAAIGAPIVGDTLYDGPKEPDLTRFFLHAAALTVTHPSSRQRLKVTSAMPDELVKVAHARIGALNT